MLNTIVPAAGEARPKITRRGILGGMAAMAAPTAALATPIANHTSSGLQAVEENPDLIAAYNRFKQVEAELTAAEEALEWIADEWRHLWPLAPEELLGNANADKYPVCSKAERDITGRFVFRDMGELTKRYSRKSLTHGEKRCFAVMTSQEADERITFWTAAAANPKGRTAKSLKINTAHHKQQLAKYEHALGLAREYEDETARLRADAGVDLAQQRIVAAKEAVRTTRNEISKVPAKTSAGLRIKADAIKASGILVLSDEMAMFIDNTLSIMSA